MILLGETPWNSLEIVKLLVGTLGPLAILILGFVINRRLQSMQHLQWANQRVCSISPSRSASASHSMTAAGGRPDWTRRSRPSGASRTRRGRRGAAAPGRMLR